MRFNAFIIAFVMALVAVMPSATLATPAIPQECIDEFGDISGWNIIVGTSGVDMIFGTMANDIIFGMAGNDTIRGAPNGVPRDDNDSDCLVGGPDADEIDGQHGNDVIVGGSGNDTLNGGYLHDYVYGGYGRDSVKGGTDANGLDHDECWGETWGEKRDYSGAQPTGYVPHTVDCEEYWYESIAQN